MLRGEELEQVLVWGRALALEVSWLQNSFPWSCFQNSFPWAFQQQLLAEQVWVLEQVPQRREGPEPVLVEELLLAARLLASVSSRQCFCRLFLVVRSF